MPDLTPTAAQVLPGTGAIFTSGTAGEALTAGTVCYLDAATKTIKTADANGTAATAVVKGIALHAADIGQPVTLQSGGELTLGAAVAMTVGGLYVLSANPGMIAPAADLAAGHYTVLLGVARTAAILKMQLFNSGVQRV